MKRNFDGLKCFSKHRNISKGYKKDKLWKILHCSIHRANCIVYSLFEHSVNRIFKVARNRNKMNSYIEITLIFSVLTLWMLCWELTMFPVMKTIKWSSVLPTSLSTIGGHPLTLWTTSLSLSYRLKLLYQVVSSKYSKRPSDTVS